jgi:hypothetical protein
MYKFAGPCNGVVTTLRGQTVTMTGKVVVRGEHIKRDNLAKIISDTYGATFKNDLTGQICSSFMAISPAKWSRT